MPDAETGHTLTFSQIYGELCAGMRQINDTLGQISGELRDTKSAIEILNQRLIAIEKQAHTSPCSTACSLTARLDRLEEAVRAHIAAKAEEIKEGKLRRNNIIDNLIRTLIIAAATTCLGWAVVGMRGWLQGD